MVKTNIVLYTCPTCGNNKATETGNQPRRCHACDRVICKKCGANSICGPCGQQFPDLEGKFKFLRFLKILFIVLIFVGVGGGLILVFAGVSPKLAMGLIFAGGGFIVISVVFMSLMQKGLPKKIAKKYKEKYENQNPGEQ